MGDYLARRRRAKALSMVRELDPEDIIRELKKTGLFEALLKDELQTYRTQANGRLKRIDRKIDSALEKALEYPEIKAALLDKIAESDINDLLVNLEYEMPVMIISDNEFEENYKDKSGVSECLGKVSLDAETFVGKTIKLAHEIGCNLAVFDYPNDSTSFYFNANTYLPVAMKKALSEIAQQEKK